MFAKVTELKGWITPCFRFTTFGDNFYEADDGRTEFMITQDQHHHVRWIRGAPQEKHRWHFSFFFFFLKKALAMSNLV